MAKRKPKPVTTRSAANAVQDERPKALKSIATPEGRHKKPVFSFALADRSDKNSWGWHLLADPDEFVSLLLDWGSKTWDELRAERAGAHKRHHWQPVAGLCSEAKKRLEDLKLDDLNDEIFRFRHGGTKRFWGFESNGVFHAIWWDPDHKVYPSEP